MEALIAMIVGAAGLAWWQRLRRRRSAAPSLEDVLDADAQVVLHVAAHEQQARGHASLGAAHLLYGLVQDDAIADAIRTTGGDATALEDRVLSMLAAPCDHQRALTDDANVMLSRAYGSAASLERKVTTRDLWAYMLRSEVAALLQAGEVDGVAVLHLLVHAMPPPELLARAGDVHVVVRNDDYTTQEFVTQLLVRVFELPEAAATTKMLETHTRGKAVLARLPAAVAHAKIRQARELARAERFPLWIGDEPA